MSYRITTSTGEVDIIEVVDWERLTVCLDCDASPCRCEEHQQLAETTEHAIPIPFVPADW